MSDNFKSEEPKPEDSMQEIEFETEEEESSTITPYKKDFDQVDSMLSQAINLTGDGKLHEPTCPICCSNIREEIEDMYDRGARPTDVTKEFREKTNTKISVDILRNHMNNHKDKGVDEIRKVEYADRVRRFYGTGQNVTTMDRIEFGMAVLTERLMEINSISPSGDKSPAEIQKIKNSETNKLMATFGNFLKLQATIMGEMRDHGEMIFIPRDKFVNVFNEAITEASTDRERENLVKLLNNLKG